MYQAWFSGTGSSLPEYIMTNHELENMVDTSDEWIVQRTGIRTRRILAKDQTTSHVAIAAGKQALEDAGLGAEELDAVIVGTVTPDSPCPAVAVIIQASLGAKNACAFDINAACTGFVYGATVASNMVQAGAFRHVLLIGAESLSRVVDFTDRNSCILFGDGAGAAILSRAEEGSDSRIIDSILRTDGRYADLIDIPAGGALHPASHQTVEKRQHFLRVKGKEVFKFATKAMVELVETAVSRNNLDINDLDLVIPHQVNYRIIEAALKKVEIPEEKIYLNLDRYGNTSAASVPIALAEATRDGRLKRGHLALCVAFGAGMTWGYNLVRW